MQHLPIYDKVTVLEKLEKAMLTFPEDGTTKPVELMDMTGSRQAE